MSEERIWSIIIAIIFFVIWGAGAIYEANRGKDRILNRRARAVLGIIIGFQWLLASLILILSPGKVLDTSQNLKILFDILLPVLLGIPLMYIIVEGLVYKAIKKVND